MVKKFEVDVEASLGYQANGRLKPAEKKDVGKLTIKKFVCPECSHSLEMSKSSFGETVLCPECKNPMYQQNPV